MVSTSESTHQQKDPALRPGGRTYPRVGKVRRATKKKAGAAADQTPPVQSAAEPESTFQRFESSDENSPRGIQNIQTTSGRSSAARTAGTVAGKFMQKRKERKRDKDNNAKPRKKKKETKQRPEKKRANRRSEAKKRLARMKRKRFTKKVRAKVTRRLLRSSWWIGLTLAFAVYIWQLWVSLFSTVSYLVEALPGVGLVLPGETLGDAAWVLNFILITFAFLGFYIYFKLQGIHPLLADPGTFFITTLAYAFSIFPATNLLPWIVLWFLYIRFLTPPHTLGSTAKHT